MMKRICECERTYYVKRFKTALNKFFNEFPEKDYWRETLEYMYENNQDFYCDDMMANGEKNDDWCYALHLDCNEDNFYICIIERAEEEPAEETKRTAEEITADIIEYFNDNEDIFNDCIEELNAYNGYLGDDRYYSMNELDELFSESEPTEILNRAFFGHDEETWHTDGSGCRVYGPFNPNREYFTFNGYGNLVSADYKDYTGFLDKYAVTAMSENIRWIDSISTDDTLSALFEELENAETNC